MDAIMAERVNKLAQSLKDLHLAATMEEAYHRAEEILCGSSEQNEEKTLKELMTAPVEEIIIPRQKEDKKPETTESQDTSPTN